MKTKKILSKDKFPYFGFGIIGGIQVFNGLLLIILGVVDVLLHYQEDSLQWPDVDKWNLHRTLTAIDVPTWCGVWFMVCGSIAGCIGRGRRIIKALNFTKGVFLFMNVVSALLLAPLSGGVAGYIVLLRHDRSNDYKELLIPVSITFLSTVQVFFACLSIGICCCCSDTKSSKGQRIVKKGIMEQKPDETEKEKKPTMKAEDQKADTHIFAVNTAPEPISEIKAVIVEEEITKQVPDKIERKNGKVNDTNTLQHDCCQQTNHCCNGSRHACNHHFQQPPMIAASNIIPIIQYPLNYPNIMTHSQQQPFLMNYTFQNSKMQENDFNTPQQIQPNDTDTERNAQKPMKTRQTSEVLGKRSVKLQVPPEIEIKDDNDAERPTKHVKPIRTSKLQMSNIETNRYYEEVSEKSDKLKSPKISPVKDQSQSMIGTRKQEKDSPFEFSTVTNPNKLENHDEISSTSEDLDDFPESNLDVGVKAQYGKEDRSYNIKPETPLRPRAVERLITPEARSGVTGKLVQTRDDFDVKSQTSEYSNDSYNTLKRLALPH